MQLAHHLLLYSYSGANATRAATGWRCVRSCRLHYSVAAASGQDHCRWAIGTQTYSLHFLLESLKSIVLKSIISIACKCTSGHAHNCGLQSLRLSSTRRQGRAAVVSTVVGGCGLNNLVGALFVGIASLHLSVELGDIVTGQVRGGRIWSRQSSLECIVRPAVMQLSKCGV